MVAGQFPERMELVASHDRMHETFGWQFLNWGFGPAGVGVWLWLSSTSLTATEQAFAGALIAASVVMVGYEAWRRKGRLVLAVGEADIAAYRHGRLERTVPRADIVLYLPEGTNTVKILGGFGLVAAAAGILTLYAPSFADRLVAATICVVCVSSAVSSFRSRARCTTLLVPRGKRRNEWVVVSREGGVRILGDRS